MDIKEFKESLSTLINHIDKFTEVLNKLEWTAYMENIDYKPEEGEYIFKRAMRVLEPLITFTTSVGDIATRWAYNG